MADALLTQGIYSHALGELYCTVYPALREVGPLFEAALRELGVPLPSSELAVRTLVAHQFELIAEGRGKPLPGFRWLDDQRYKLHDFPGRAELVRLSSDYAYWMELIEIQYVGLAEGGRRLTDWPSRK